MFLESNNHISIYRVLHLNINIEVGMNITFYLHCHFNDFFILYLRIEITGSCVLRNFLQDVPGAMDVLDDNTIISLCGSETNKVKIQTFLQEMCYFIHLLQ